MAPERLPLPLADDNCPSCGLPPGVPHGEECLLAEHQAMLAGDETARLIHDPDECYWCAAQLPPILSECRCGNCCRRLLIEVDPEDARREPKIKELGSPIYTAAELTMSGQKELQGYMLNSAANGYACAFLDQPKNLCTIHETRPLACRLFECDASDVKSAAPSAADALPLPHEGTLRP